MTKDPIKHILIPLHEKVTDKEKTTILEKYNITDKELPKISMKDPAIQHLEAKPGDVIKITRDSPTAGVSIFYRGVSSD